MSSQVLNISRYLDTTMPLHNFLQCLTPLFLFSVIGIYCIASCAVLGYHWEEFGSIFLTTSHQEFIHVDKRLLSLLFSRVNSPSSLSLFSYSSNPFINLMTFLWIHFSMHPALEPILQVCPTRVEQRGRNNSWWCFIIQVINEYLGVLAAVSSPGAYH